MKSTLACAWLIAMICGTAVNHEATVDNNLLVFKTNATNAEEMNEWMNDTKIVRALLIIIVK